MQGQLEGQQIGRYLIRQQLGGGGVATVYRAYDQVDGHVVALKVLPPNPDPATLDRFRREALRAGALRHPHIVRVLQVGTAGGNSAYLAMDLVEGESLAALLARIGQLQADESCLLLEPVARALAFAHSRGVVHRDVKPSNILLRPDTARSQSTSSQSTPSDPQATSHRVSLEGLPTPVVPMLSDFGIARYLDAPELTDVGRTVGTPAFMAPEQCMGSREVDGRADIYALGTVLYRCVTGKLPFSGSTTQILHAHVFEPVVLDDEVARALPLKVLEILRRALAKAPEMRYQRAEELADALADAGANAVPSVARRGEKNATATMTLAQVAAVQSPSVSAVQVLVPGATTLAVTAATPARPAPQDRGRSRRGPKWERMLWAAFFSVLVGIGLWNARAWLGFGARQEGEQLTLPPVILVTYTPQPTFTAAPGAQAGGGEVAIAITPNAVEPTALPTATMPPPTPTQPPPPTATPIPATPVPATPAPATVNEIVPTPIPVATATVAPTPAEVVAGVCAVMADEHFLASIGQLQGELQQEFACATAPARLVQGEWLPFEQGMMVALEGEPLIYVYYDDGAWEQVARGEESQPPAGPVEEGQSQPPPIPLPFARVLEAEGRHLLLGEPLQNEPLRAPTIVQPFQSGLAVGRQDGSEVLFLARSKLRF